MNEKPINEQHNETVDDLWRRYQELYALDAPRTDIEAAYAKWQAAIKEEDEE